MAVDFRDCTTCEDRNACPDVTVGVVACQRFGGEAYGDLYCSTCGSCGIGGCCSGYCPECRHVHDEAEEIKDAQGVGDGAL